MYQTSNMTASTYKRRGKLSLSAQTVAILACLLCFALAAMSLTQPSVHTSKTTMVTVSAGDTLWTLAQTYDKSDRPDAVVEEIMRLNHLSSADIQPGMTLEVPMGK